MEFGPAAEEHLMHEVDDILSEMERVLDDDVYDILVDHVDEVDGYNRGNTSVAYTTHAHGRDSCTLRLQNSASRRVIVHELGHAMVDAYGYDTSNEATTRASNKQNTSRWPQFSFGTKDSPAERFMLRRYTDLDDIYRGQFNLDDARGRSDFFVHDDRYYEPHGYKTTFEHREDMRYRDPFHDDEFDATSVFDIGNTTLAPHNAEMLNRYEVTPGLCEALTDNTYEQNGFADLVREINTTWYDIAIGVRKRGDARKTAKKKAPRGATSSYYVMNAHEYFAELSAVLIRDEWRDTSSTRIKRLEEFTDVVELYRDTVLDVE